MISPILEQYSKKYTNANYVKVDVDKLPEIAQEWGITAMPTFMVFKQGDKVDELIGANPGRLETLIVKNTEVEKEKTEEN
jgi:thioredoxin 1